MRLYKNRDYFYFAFDYSSKAIVKGATVVINIMLLKVPANRQKKMLIN